MADCEFRSPRFSEELPYLPPWLQPHLLPKVLTGVNDKSSTPVQPFQGIFDEKNICLEQTSQQVFCSEDRYNSCHLYLSGDTNLLHGSVSSTGNVRIQARHLSLHFSCTTSQDNNTPGTTYCETSRTTNTKPAIEVQKSQKEKTKSHVKVATTETLTLSQADVEEAIELSIAASEAMVITEVVSLDSDTSHFPVCNALEAALLVKEARKQLFENSSGASLQQDDDEQGSLSDLDECAMTATYADVGFFDKGTPDSNSYNHSLDSCRDSTLVPCSINYTTCTPQVSNFRNPSPKGGSTGTIESEKGEVNNFIGVGKNDEGLESNLEKDQEVPIQGKNCTIKIKKPFIRESSFISESMDAMILFPFPPVKELGNEIVASSTPTNARTTPLTEGLLSSTDDALCSVVPCSLSDPHMEQTSNEDKNMVDLQENFSRFQNAQDGSGPVRRMSTLNKYSVGIRDVQFNEEPQFFNKKHPDDTDIMLDEVCEDVNSRKNSDLKGRQVVVTIGSKNKRVRFLEGEFTDKETKKSERVEHKKGHCSSKSRTRVKYVSDCTSRIRKKKCSSFAGNTIERKEMIFKSLNFLLTGISNKKLRELQVLIRRYGGCVFTKLPDCPSDLRGKLVEYWRPPVVICPRKVATTKFLYGCAIDSWVLNPQWLIDSVHTSRLLPPSKYVIRQPRLSAWSSLDRDIFWFRCHTHIFHGMGFLLHGKVGFSSKYSNIIKHGGGQIFQSLQRLVYSLTAKNTETGVVLVENEAMSSRHLKLCALEHNIQTLPVSWIIKTLYAGELAPFKRDNHRLFRGIKASSFKANVKVFDMSQEI